MVVVAVAVRKRGVIESGRLHGNGDEKARKLGEKE